MSDAFAAVPAPLRHLAAAIQGLHIPGGEPSNTGEEEQTPMKGVTFLRLLKDKKGRSFNDLSRWEPPAILFFSKKVCTYLNSTYPSPDDAEELQIWMYYSLVTQETTIHWSSSNKHYEHKSILRKQLFLHLGKFSVWSYSVLEHVEVEFWLCSSISTGLRGILAQLSPSRQGSAKGDTSAPKHSQT